MIEWAKNNLFGTWGPAAIDFYGEHALPINLVVIAYGVFLLVMHRRLRVYRDAAMAQVIPMVERSKSHKGRHLEKHVAQQMDWEAVAAAWPQGIVVGRWQLFPRRPTAEAVRRALPIGELCRDARDGYKLPTKQTQER